MLVLVCVIAMITNPVGIAIIVFGICYYAVKRTEEEKQNEDNKQRTIQDIQKW